MSTSVEKLHAEAQFEHIVPKVKILRLANLTTKVRDVNQLSKQTIWLTSGFTMLTSRKTMFADAPKSGKPTAVNIFPA